MVEEWCHVVDAGPWNDRRMTVVEDDGLAPLLAGERDSVDANHASPAFTEKGLQRLKLIPKDGGDWPELLKVPGGENFLIPSMQRHVAQGKVGPYRDVYGRMWWDRPSVTLKRECSPFSTRR